MKRTGNYLDLRKSRNTLAVRFFKYVIGVVNLERLYDLTGTTWQFGCFYSEYRKKGSLNPN